MDSTITNRVGKIIWQRFNKDGGKKYVPRIMWESGHGWMNDLRISGSIMNDVLYSCRLPREQIIPEYF